MKKIRVGPTPYTIGSHTRPLRALYVAIDRSTPWVAAVFAVGGLAMAVLTAWPAKYGGPFTFDRIDAHLGAVAAWLAAMVLGYQLGRDHVLEEAEDAGVDD